MAYASPHNGGLTPDHIAKLRKIFSGSPFALMNKHPETAHFLSDTATCQKIVCVQKNPSSPLLEVFLQDEQFKQLCWSLLALTADSSQNTATLSPLLQQLSVGAIPASPPQSRNSQPPREAGTTAAQIQQITQQIHQSLKDLTAWPPMQQVSQPPAPLPPSTLPQFQPFVVPPPPPPPDENNSSTASNVNPLPQLFAATRRGDVELVKNLLASFDDVILYEGDELGNTILHIAAQTNQIEIVRYLIQHNHMDLNICSLTGYTPLILAVLEGHLEMTKLLLSHGADANIRDNSGATAVDYALVNQQEEILSLLLESAISFGSALNVDQANRPPPKDPRKMTNDPSAVSKPTTTPTSNSPNHYIHNQSESNLAGVMSAFFCKPHEVKTPLAPTSRNPNEVYTTTTATATVVTSSKTSLSAMPAAEKNEEMARLFQHILELEEAIKVLEESRNCTICMEREINTVILECGHVCVCMTCANNHNLLQKKCPVCNTNVTRIVRTYRSSTLL